MGSANASVTSQARQVIFNNAPLTAVSNEGVTTIYLDTVPSVSPSSNEYTLRGGDRITWLPNTPCWAATDPGITGQLSTTSNVLQFSTVSIVGPPTVATLSAITGIITQGSYTLSGVTYNWYRLGAGATFNATAGLAWIVGVHGGGGGCSASGGGGGSVYDNSAAYLTAGSHTVGIGAGGASHAFPGVATPGSATTLDGIPLPGGGGGAAGGNDYQIRGGDGGNGGGCGGNAIGAGEPGGLSTCGGFAGGSGGGPAGGCGGGGGGAGGAGSNGAGGVNGNGGAGKQTLITGVAVFLGGGGGKVGGSGGGGSSDTAGTAGTGGGGGPISGVSAGSGGSGAFYVAVQAS